MSVVVADKLHRDDADGIAKILAASKGKVDVNPLETLTAIQHDDAHRQPTRGLNVTLKHCLTCSSLRQPQEKKRHLQALEAHTDFDSATEALEVLLGLG